MFVIGILLTVLKIIGIIILSILGILILLVLLALFVPIRYACRGEYYSDLEGVAKVHWLFRIIWIKYVFNEKQSYFDLRIFGIKFYSTRFIERKLARAAKKESKVVAKTEGRIAVMEALNETTDFEQKKSTVELDIKIIGEELKQEKLQDRIDKEIQEENNVNHNSDNKDEMENIIQEDVNESKKVNEVRDTNEVDKKEKRKKKSKFHKKLCQILFKVQNFLTKIKIFFLKIIKFIKNIKEKIRIIYINVIDPGNREAVKLIFKSSKVLFKHIWPRKAKVKIKFGMEDPAVTGYVLGASSVFSARYGKRVQIDPVFDTDETFIQGEGKFKGRIYLIVVLRQLLKLYKNKKIKRLINKLSQGGTNNG